MKAAIPLPTQIAIDKEMIRRKGLAEFMKRAWSLVEPGYPLEWNWHLDVVCEAIQALYVGDIKRLLINVPPRTTKSITAAIMAPAWEWSQRPETKMGFVSYSQKLSSSDSMKCRRLIESDWYQARWGDKVKLAADENTQTKYSTTANGVRYASSVGGTITGMGADIWTGDDLMSKDGAESEAYQEQCSNFLWETLPSRFNDRKKGRLGIIQQRLISNDPTGEILEREADGRCEHYEKVILPMEFEPGRFLDMAANKVLKITDPRTKEGEILHKKRFPQKVLDSYKADLGSYAWAGQFQQRPAPREGGIIKLESLENTFDCGMSPAELMKRKPMMVIESTDTASKPGERNDPTAKIIAGVFKDHIEIWYVIVKRMEFPEGLSLFHQIAKDWKLNVTLIEDKDSGQAYIQQLKSDKSYRVPIIKANPDNQDKVTRLVAESPYIEAKKIWLPKNALWKKHFVEELTTFPSSPHKDQVDALSQLIKFVRLKMSSLKTVAPSGVGQISSHSLVMADGKGPQFSAEA